MASQLCVRSVYSLLSSMCSIEGLLLKCKDYGYKAVALVDKDVLSGAMSFSKECQKAQIKPVFGLEVTCNYEDREHNVILYAKDNQGFLNLMALSSLIKTSDKEFIDADTLIQYKEHCFVVFESDDMPLTHIADKDMDFHECMDKMVRTFGNSFLIGLMDHDYAINCVRDQKIKSYAKAYNIKTLALNRTYYLNRDDAYEFEILKCIKEKRILEKDISLQTGRYFLDKDEFASMYDEEDIKNTDVLVSLCNVTMVEETSLPKYQTPQGVDSKTYLTSLAKEGLKRRLKNNINNEYAKRLQYELDVINKMHFEDYFLIVYDFILFAKKKNIMVGPGRGSAAGSLVSYCLGITDIDPIKYGLLFERFLNPERITMPDIDTDFPDDRRDEVFEYVAQKYGKEHVAHIITYGTLKAKQVLRDVGRVLNYSTRDLDNITKPIPLDPHMTLELAYNTSPIFKQRIESEKKYRDLYHIALKLEGFPRHASTHAAGIVFSSKNLEEVVPLIRIENDIYSTQYTMEHLEELGLIKMDFLGLRNLGIISEIVEDIQNNVNPNFNIKAIPINDAKTFELIDNVNLLGVFQLESSGMMNLARKMKPRSFEELSMMIALFRPGPMENIPEFLENRNNPSRIHYITPELKPILEETYGIIVYQEQIMTIARQMAGFTLAKSDVLRRAMSKKKLSELEKLYADFMDGCKKNGYSEVVANEIYELILKFANYGFNKSHSIAYGMVAYEMAYLKANYPLYFYKALLNGVIGSELKTFDYISECQKVGVTIRNCSINHSDVSYVIKNNQIIMPFGVIKDLGSVAGQKILEERKEGPFTDFIDSVVRLVSGGVEKNVIENLVYGGAFDEFGLSRYSMSKSLENVLKYAQTHSKQVNLISSIDDKPIIENLKDNKQVLAAKEKEVLGFYFSFNPILEYKKERGITCPCINDLINTRSNVSGFGLIRRVKEHKTKRNELMAFIDIVDDSGAISLAVMPDVYKQCQSFVEKDKYILFTGRLDKEDSILVKTIKEA